MNNDLLAYMMLVVLVMTATAMLLYLGGVLKVGWINTDGFDALNKSINHGMEACRADEAEKISRRIKASLSGYTELAKSIGALQQAADSEGIDEFSDWFYDSIHAWTKSKELPDSDQEIQIARELGDELLRYAADRLISPERIPPNRLVAAIDKILAQSND